MKRKTENPACPSSFEEHSNMDQSLIDGKPIVPEIDSDRDQPFVEWKLIVPDNDLDIDQSLIAGNLLS